VSASRRGSGDRSITAFICLLIAAATVFGTALVMLVRPIDFTAGVFAYIASFIPYGLITLAIGLVAAIIARSTVLVVIAVVLVCIQVWWLVPLYTKTATNGAPTITVMTANIKVGQGDAATVVADARDGHADLLAIQELTPDAVQRLVAAGVDHVFPYAYLVPGETFHGTGLWSRTPLSRTSTWPGFALNQIQAVTTIRGQSLAVVVVHIAAPQPRLGGLWATEMQQLTARLHVIPGPVLALGDFNSTYDVAAYRKVVSDGFADATDQAGAGFLRTFPVGARVPPLFQLDHVVSRDLGSAATHVQTLNIPGSDHHGLLVRFAGLK
jgi:endonuclease/exonuclease/phosphatase (EEP) superfamily protein YafD